MAKIELSSTELELLIGYLEGREGICMAYVQNGDAITQKLKAQLLDRVVVTTTVEIPSPTEAAAKKLWWLTTIGALTQAEIDQLEVAETLSLGSDNESAEFDVVYSGPRHITQKVGRLLTEKIERMLKQT